ncbi:diguanylate cyclase [Desulfovibrio sp. TomC]|uniref:diguanylate cyclase n=1 Tax=Desulfovibrio sp. TomC TaxID=1562888 RepID=UPI0018CE3831|nr:diguanylate cyclase [Desulfovibrio sp. TomC]
MKNIDIYKGSIASLDSDNVLFANAFHYAAIGMALVGTDGRWLKVNQSFCNLVKYTESELLERTFQDITHPEDLDDDLNYVQRMLSGELEKYEMEKRYISKTKKIVYVRLSVSLVFDKDLSPQFFISQIQDISKSKQLEQELVRMVSEDFLTKIGNRRYFFDHSSTELERAARFNEPLCLLMIDIDNFKNINDSYGHDTGDIVLTKLAKICKESIRSIDILGRLGGEEFSILLLNTDVHIGTIVANRIRTNIESSSIYSGGHSIKSTISIGMVSFTGDNKPLGVRLKQADMALYQAKENGRNKVEVFNDSVTSFGIHEKTRTGFIKLVWQQSYESGNSIIDQQHEQLFKTANELLESMLAGLPQDTCIDAIKKLCADISNHFSDEEGILKSVGYPAIENHCLIHKTLATRATQILNDYTSGATSLGSIFSFLALDVIYNHMIIEDKKFFTYVRA